MFAIIDIETCGSKYEFKRGRITEICIALHDGLQVTEKWTTLINPECYITPYFISLSGITNEMVADAPKFHEVAKKIIEMTEGRIFVAHNVGFDYGFIKDEFNSLGYKYRRETLCTVRLSRKLMPGKLSYSLGKLCESIGIEVENRHRAEGDVDATVKLFDRLLELKALNPQYKNKGVEELMTRRIDKIKEYILNKLPDECGVYYFLNKEQEIIYIGKSKNVYQRAVSHFNSKEQKGKKMLNDLYNVDFVPTGSELIALLLEAEEIKKHKPFYNRRSKASEFTHAIDGFYDEKGILNFKLSAYEDCEQAIVAFNNYASARERLENWIDEYDLCLRYCGLTGEESICFNHQIKKCKGICANEEEIEQYNKRASQILTRYLFPHPNFAIIGKGRKDHERSIVVIDNGRYYGFGYFDAFDQINDAEEFKGFVSNKLYYPDTNLIIKGWMNREEPKIKVL